MNWQFAVVAEVGKGYPLGVVVHTPNTVPDWLATNDTSEAVMRMLFGRESVYGNVPVGNGYIRVRKTRGDEDFIDFACVKANLPVYIQYRGVWDTEATDVSEILKYLSKRFFKEGV